LHRLYLIAAITAKFSSDDRIMLQNSINHSAQNTHLTLFGIRLDLKGSIESSAVVRTYHPAWHHPPEPLQSGLIAPIRANSASSRSLATDITDLRPLLTALSAATHGSGRNWYQLYMLHRTAGFDGAALRNNCSASQCSNSARCRTARPRRLLLRSATAVHRARGAGSILRNRPVHMLLDDGPANLLVPGSFEAATYRGSKKLKLRSCV